MTNADATAAALAAEIASLCETIAGNALIQRARWLEVGGKLAEARVLFPQNTAFGAWVKTSGIDALPGLETPASRADLLWMVDHPARVEKVDAKISHPRGIRGAWRREWMKAVETELDALIDLEATDVPDLEAAAQAIVDALAADMTETFNALSDRLKAHESGSLEEQAMNRAVSKLKGDLQAAADAGITSAGLCVNAGAVWGGFFGWSVTPQTSVADLSAEALAEALATKVGGKLAAVALLSTLATVEA